MKKNLIRWIMVALALTVLGGCATNVTKSVTSGDMSRLHAPNFRMDTILMGAALDGTVEELKVFQLEYVDAAGKPVVFYNDKGVAVTVLRWHETARSLPFTREFVLGLSPGAAVAFINGRTARRVAQEGCKEDCGPTYYNSADAVAVSEQKMEAVLTTNPLSCQGPCGRAGR
jgi:hypothetical protein